MSDSCGPVAVAHQAPLFMEFSREEILEWAAVSFSRGPPSAGAGPAFPASSALADRLYPSRAGEALSPAAVSRVSPAFSAFRGLGCCISFPTSLVAQW